MISVTTAKLLLLVALCLGPKGTLSYMVTANDENCVWTQEAHGWNLVEKGRPTTGWPANGVDYSTQDLNAVDPENRATVRSIRQHDWSKDSVLFLDNGDRVEKHGTKVFYTARPGAASQQVYIILAIENNVPL
jgi:hypothetical protein